MRTCSSALCTKNDLRDNGSCSDYWPDYCCSAHSVIPLNVSCEGFSYTIAQVNSCECQVCSQKTVVNGRAFGRRNGEEIPLRFGQVIVGGKTITYTSNSGVFSFDVLKGAKRLVVSFHDKFNALSDVTKVTSINVGSGTFMTVVMPIKQPPLPFDANNGTEVHLGNEASEPPIATLSIPANAMTTVAGEYFHGRVNASLQFIDPRKREDIEAATGEFESEAPDGSKLPMQTYGLFDLSLTDYEGNKLLLSKPMKYTMDASLFEVPLDENGQPDVAMWHYDVNKGTWIEVAKMRKETATAGRRKLLQSSDMYVVEFHPPNVPQLDLYTTKLVRQWTGEYSNCDHSVKIYETVQTTTAKAGACYVAVSIYKDLSLQEVYTDTDIEIKTYVQQLRTRNYVGSTSTKVLNKGRACIPIFCNMRVYISVTRTGGERLFPGRHSLPFSGFVKNTSNHEILFESLHLGISSIKNGKRVEGPIFLLREKSRCDRIFHALDDSFQFKFAPSTKAPTLTTCFPENVFYEKLSWYPVPKDSRDLRSCFMKVALKASSFTL